MIFLALVLMFVAGWLGGFMWQQHGINALHLEVDDARSASRSNREYGEEMADKYLSVSAELRELKGGPSSVRWSVKDSAPEDWG